jgi:hypothetical protein
LPTEPLLAGLSLLVELLLLSLLLAKLLPTLQLLLLWLLLLLTMLLLLLLKLKMLLAWLLLAELLLLLLAELLPVLLAKLMLLLLVGLVLLLPGLLSLLLEWPLQLAWLMLLLLLAELLLAELLLLLLLLLLALLSFLPPRPPYCIFSVLAFERWRGADCPACARVEDYVLQERSRCARRLHVFKNQSGPGAHCDELLVLRQETHNSLCKSGKWWSGISSCTHVAVCLTLLNHQAGGDLHSQLASAWPLRPLSSAFTTQLSG